MTTAVEPSVEEGQYLAVVFDPERGGPGKIEALLRYAIEHPEWFSTPVADEDRAAVAWAILTHPQHLAWEVWRGDSLVGIILLTDISPKVDARLHYLFFDRDLVGKTRLLRRFLRYCFDDLGFQRISMWVPEYVSSLVSFARRKLKFTYEGEAALRTHPTVLQWKQRSPGDGTHVWMASQGSRRERAHFHNGEWCDVLCLRITGPEYRVFFGE